MEAVRKLDASAEFGMEAMRHYWLPLYAHLRQARQTVLVINPLQSDALRELCRQRFFVVDMASDLKRKIIALLDQIFPEYEKLFSDTFAKSSMELLANYTSPEEMLSVDSQTPLFIRGNGLKEKTI